MAKKKTTGKVAPPAPRTATAKLAPPVKRVDDVATRLSKLEAQVEKMQKILDSLEYEDEEEHTDPLGGEETKLFPEVVADDDDEYVDDDDDLDIGK